MSAQQEAVVDRLIEAYNRGDAKAFAALFAPDATVFSYPGVAMQEGAAAIEAEYARVFERFPGGRTETAHRSVIGSRVVDLERVTRREGGEAADVLTLYTVENDRITRAEMLTAVQAEAA